MGSSASNTKQTYTSSSTVSTPTNIVTTINKGTDATALATALGAAFNEQQNSITAQQQAFWGSALGALQSLTAGNVAQSSGSMFESPGASSVTREAQAAAAAVPGWLLWAAVGLVVLLLWRR